MSVVDSAVSFVGRLPLAAQLALVPLAVIVANICWQLLPQDPNTPPTVFHWFPFIGSAISYGTDPLNFFFSNREKYGNVFTFVLFGRRVTAALGPQGNNFVLGGKSTVFNAEDAYTHFTTPVFGTGVVYDVPNEVFMEQKRFAKVAFSVEAFRAYVGEIEAEVEDFMNTDPVFAAYRSPSREWGKFDVVKTMQELIILTAARSLQGMDVRRRMDKTFADMYNDLDGGFTPLNFMFPSLPLPSYRRRDIAHQKMSKFYNDIIKQRREAGTFDQEHDVMASFMSQHYKNGKPFGDTEVAHMMIALLMAGQHTSTATSSWTLLEIAARPDVLQALLDEQMKHFGAPDGSMRSPTYDELRALPILDSTIRETLRCHPPIHSIMRKVRDHVTVPTSLSTPRTKSGDGVYVVPQGNYVLATPYVSQMDSTIWKDAHTWEPSRWSDPDGVAADALRKYTDESGEKVDFGFGAVSKGTDSPYQPFGAGRHRCIGEQFAYLQIGLIISTLVRKLELKLENPVPDINFHTMIVMPKDPKVISYRRRE